MSNKVKDIDIKNRKYYFYDDIINIRIFYCNNITIDEKSYKNILIYYIAYVTIKYSKYLKVNSVDPLYLIFGKVNEHFEEINGNKHLKLVPTKESKEKIKKYEELWIKIRYLIRSITMLKSNDELPLNKTIEIYTMTIVVRAVFHKNNKYYPQVFLDECVYKI